MIRSDIPVSLCSSRCRYFGDWPGGGNPYCYRYDCSLTDDYIGDRGFRVRPNGCAYIDLYNIMFFNVRLLNRHTGGHI